MKTERSNVKYPLWRKKVDASFLDGVTPIPSWVNSMWMVEKIFQPLDEVPKRLDVHIKFEKHIYHGQLSMTRAPRDNRFFRLFWEKDLSIQLQRTFLMSYMRTMENKLGGNKLAETENEIPFWEFIDIEFDSQNLTFIFVPYFIQKSSFPNLFARLIDAPSMNMLHNEIQGKNHGRIYKQTWKKRSELEYELGAKNVVYFLIDTKRNLLYIGKAEDLVQRLNQPHPSINEWDFFRYNVLPYNADSFRLQIERMLITDYAYILENKKSLEFKDLSGYSLTNDKIDQE